MSPYDYVVIAAAAYLGLTATVAIFLVGKGTLDVLGRRADIAIDSFVMREGPGGWGSIVVFPIVTNVGSAMLVAGSVAAMTAWRHGDLPWWGYSTALAGLAVAIGVPVWASREVTDPDRVGASVLIHRLSQDVNEDARGTALTAIARKKADLEAKIAKVHGAAYKTYAAMFTVGALWFAALAVVAGGLDAWAIVGGYVALTVVTLLVRGTAQQRSLQRTVRALDGYRARVLSMRPASGQVEIHRHLGSGWAILIAVVVGAVLPDLIRGRRRGS